MTLKGVCMTTTEVELELYRQTCDLFDSNPDWATFYRQVLGVNGLVRQGYATPQALAEFERTETYARIHQMLAKLRNGKVATSPVEEETLVITVRLPKSLHESLKEEAYERRTSINKLCISKLLQYIDTELIPSE
jgi:predicted HicB family RNase H-like nuclease